MCPIYEYFCSPCDCHFEKQKSIKGDSSKEYCPLCHHSVGKIPSLSSFHLIGAGWFKDGYNKPTDRQK